MLIKLDATMGSGELLYHPGDHVAIFAENSASLVDAILMRLHNAPSPDQLIKIEVMNERSTPMGMWLHCTDSLMHAEICFRDKIPSIENHKH
ncbi:hypothetical protein DPMN_015925 [Dreissena polymorpha]|uniref:nitric-oxide synthase (NADPH) n=1 Tax=Dreissena polymorpha TaxID=45954 RepID=A0A9D4N8P8_DREPO|nr:hypothetical protein DPMN_015925 [Dreissena polymorpha]